MSISNEKNKSNKKDREEFKTTIDSKLKRIMKIKAAALGCGMNDLIEFLLVKYLDRVTEKNINVYSNKREDIIKSKIENNFSPCIIYKSGEIISSKEIESKHMTTEDIFQYSNSNNSNSYYNFEINLLLANLDSLDNEIDFPDESNMSIEEII